MNDDKIRVRNCHEIELKRIVDERDGILSIMEGGRDVPFSIQRIYYINHLENDGSVRGKHAHKKLQQAIFCLSGSFLLSLDDGTEKQEVSVWRDHVGYYLGPGLWHTMSRFSSGCVVLVVASDYYDESDYIRDYQKFLAWVKEQ